MRRFSTIRFGTGRLQAAVRVVAAAAVVAAAVDLFVALPGAIRSACAAYRMQTQSSVSDRQMAPAFNYDVSRAFVQEAQILLPPDARYVFRTGPHSGASMAVTVSAAPFVSRYLLLPRQSEARAADASWLLCYGCNLGRAPTRTHVVWRESDAPGLVIARLTR